MFFGEIVFKGEIWNYVFLIGNPKLSDEDREDIFINTVEMYYKKQLKRKIKGKNYEGIITTDGKKELLVNFYGQHFDANLETNKGRVKISALVAKAINPVWN